ncbi:hypothetical protein [Kitasatospora sp. NPDC058046]|uniref:hypothetical protein n=1 Tax=Kitasatospora sp. NPDC058046 TaxID=3346312 RepID=UPI0036DD812E
MSCAPWAALVGSGTAAAVAAAAVLAPHLRRAQRMTPLPVRGRIAAVVPPSGCDVTDFYECPAEHRRRPHAVSADGARRCWQCGHETPGETR